MAVENHARTRLAIPVAVLRVLQVRGELDIEYSRRIVTSKSPNRRGAATQFGNLSRYILPGMFCTVP